MIIIFYHLKIGRFLKSILQTLLFSYISFFFSLYPSFPHFLTFFPFVPLRQRNITHIFDLKGSSRARYVNVEHQQQTASTTQSTNVLSDRDSGREKEKEKGKVDGIDESLLKRRKARRLKAASALNDSFNSFSSSSSKLATLTDPMLLYKNTNTNSDAHLNRSKNRGKIRNKDKKIFLPVSSQVLLDDNLMERTHGRPFPLKHKAKVLYYRFNLLCNVHCVLYCVVSYLRYSYSINFLVYQKAYYVFMECDMIFNLNSPSMISFIFDCHPHPPHPLHSLVWLFLHFFLPPIIAFHSVHDFKTFFCFLSFHFHLLYVTSHHPFISSFSFFP